MASITNISSPTQYHAGIVIYEEIIKLTDTKFILKYQDQDDNYTAKVMVGNIDGSGNVTFGSEYSIISGVDIGTGAVQIRRLDDNRFFAVWYDAATPFNNAARVGTVSGNTISLGSVYTYLVASKNPLITSCALDANTVVFGLGDSGDVDFYVATITGGNVISYSSPLQFSSDWLDYFSATALDSQYFVLMYTNRDLASDKGRVALGKYTGGTLSFVDDVAVSNSFGMGATVDALTSDTFVCTLNNLSNSNKITGLIGSRSGDSLTLGTKYVLDDSGTGIMLDTKKNTRLDDTHFAVTYRDGSNVGWVVLCELAGTLITPGTPQQTYSGFYRTAALEQLNDDYTFLAYSQETTGTTASYKVLTTEGVGIIPDIENPVVSISVPTALETYITNSSTIAMAGNASDNVELTEVTWSNSAGGSGTATGTTSWSIPSIPLSEGENIITITATDTSTNTGTDTLTVTKDSADPIVTITKPRQNYPTGLSAVDLAGTVTDDSTITLVDWVSSNSESGTASGTVNWDVYGASLVKGPTTFQVNGHDEAGNIGFSTVVVDQIPNRNKAKGIYDSSNIKGNIRGKAADGWVRPTIKQFFTTADFTEIPKNLTAKSVVFDFANNWGKTSYMGVRAVQFYLNDELIVMTSGFGAYATTFYNSAFVPEYAFNTSLSLAGSWSGTSWMSGLNLRTNQRLNVVFNTPLEFNKIILVNTHTSGGQTDTGVRNTVVTLSDDPIVNTTYNNPIANGTVVFNGEIPQYGSGGESFVIVES